MATRQELGPPQRRCLRALRRDPIATQRTYLHDLVGEPGVVVLAHADKVEVDVVLAVRVKARRHEDEVRREVHNGRQDLVAPRPPPEVGLDAGPGHADVDDAGALPPRPEAMQRRQELARGVFRGAGRLRGARREHAQVRLRVLAPLLHAHGCLRCAETDYWDNGAVQQSRQLIQRQQRTPRH